MLYRAAKVTCIILVAIACVLAILYIFNLHIRLGLIFQRIQFLQVMTALLFPMTFLLVRSSKGIPRERIPWYDVLAAALSFATPLYMAIAYTDALLAAWVIHPPTQAVVLGLIMCLLALEGTRRAVGVPFTIIVALLAASPLYVQYLPEIVRGPGISFSRTIAYFYCGGDGIFGMAMEVFGTLLISFLIFGVVVQVTGAGKSFTDLALSLLGHTKGGAAKVAVVASGLFGTISGAGTANVLVTGAVTIPMMKKGGYPDYFAGAVEAVASSGGMLMPPVMGAVAFIMAAFLGVPYWEIALAAIFPACLYYLALFLQVHFRAENKGLTGVPRSELPRLWPVIKQGVGLWVVVGLLVWLLFVVRMNAGQAASYTCLALVLACAARKETRPNRQMLVQLGEQIVEVFLRLIPILVVIGMLIGGVFLSGIGFSLTQWVATGAEQNLALVIALAVVASYVLGMGMGGLPVYILLGITLAPAMVALGLNMLSVHMALLYWAVVAVITPPVAVMAYVAAAYAGSPPFKTALQAMRLAVVIYIVPILFMLNPVLLLQEGGVVDFIRAAVPLIAGLCLIARGFEGYAPPMNSVKLVKRIGSVVGAVMLFTGIWQFEVVGGIIAGALLFVGARSSPMVLRLVSRLQPNQREKTN